MPKTAARTDDPRAPAPSGGRNGLQRKFFIVGCPRSGTTVLQQALNRHSRIVIPPETAFFFSFLGHNLQGQHNHVRRLRVDLQIELPLPEQRISTPADARAFYEQLAGLYLERLGRTGVTSFGDKSPEHLRRLPDIRRVFPEAKIILMYRDGRDVALSLTKMPWMHADLYVDFAVWLYYYRIQQREQAAADPNLLCVKYEALVTDPIGELTKVAAFLGLPYEPQMAEGHGNPEGVPGWEYAWKGMALEKITTSRIGLWRQALTPEELGRLERWGGEALQSLGYELATDRSRRLPAWFFPRLAWKVGIWRAMHRLRRFAREYRPR